MSSIATQPHSGDNHGGDHPPFLAHHFDTPSQQYSSAKLGMWVFLGTELLMFGGLFVAYSIYRHNHPEVFEYAHVYLNKWWGGLNTVILLVSSFTMAWGVRAAQLGQQRLLAVLLALTIAGGAGFMCIKYVEYKSKWEHHLFPGAENVFHTNFTPPKGETRTEVIKHLEQAEASRGAAAAGAHGATSPAQPADAHATDATAAPPAPHTASVPLYVDPNAGTGDEAKIKPNFITPPGLAPAVAHKPYKEYSDLAARDRVRVSTFFSIYFAMTGLHGLHVLVGMALIAWVLIKSFSGVFGPAYYTPVDLVGLYWHLVDLIWIFLFPLLYLIH
jgi:cytochrome c oxidase subunit 3